jgi:hypothetical protein
MLNIIFCFVLLQSSRCGITSMNPNALVNLDTCSLMRISFVFTAMKLFAKMCVTAVVTVLA